MTGRWCLEVRSSRCRSRPFTSAGERRLPIGCGACCRWEAGALLVSGGRAAGEARLTVVPRRYGRPSIRSVPAPIANPAAATIAYADQSATTTAPTSRSDNATAATARVGILRQLQTRLAPTFGDGRLDRSGGYGRRDNAGARGGGLSTTGDAAQNRGGAGRQCDRQKNSSAGARHMVLPFCLSAPDTLVCAERGGPCALDESRTAGGVFASLTIDDQLSSLSKS